MWAQKIRHHPPLKCSVVLSSTTFSNASYPFNTPVAEKQVATTLENLTMKDHGVIVTGSLSWYDISTTNML